MWNWNKNEQKKKKEREREREAFPSFLYTLAGEGVERGAP